MVIESFPLGIPAGMAALAFNTRRAIFKDQRVRQALILLFDFEWINRTLYHGAYRRTQSYFERSELSAHGRPTDETETTLLAPFAGAVKPAVLDGSYALPVSAGDGRNREHLREAIGLLKEAGYEIREGVLVDRATGAPFRFEVMTQTREQERLMLSYAQALKRAGIEMTLRQVEGSQYQSRLQKFDFDMIQTFWWASLSPGNEQIFRWSTKLAAGTATFNYPGVDSPAVDAMIGALLKARDRASFVSAVRALDRVLISGDYVVPLFHVSDQFVARWRQLKHPAVIPLNGVQLDCWWIDPEAK